MPPKKDDAVTAAAAANKDASERAIVVATKFRVVSLLQHAHITTSKHSEHKKTIVSLFQQHPAAVQDTLRRAALRVTSLAPQLPADVINRHVGFLLELCKELRSTTRDDSLAASLIQTVLPYHTAVDKSVRESIANLVSSLLKALNSELTDPAKQSEREKLYDEIVSAMQDRAADKAPAVRERAVNALCLFQKASSDDDITQLLLALLCEDSSADVRRSILLGIHPHREIYFPSVARLTRDKVATVRMAAWDLLGQYKLSRASAFAKKYHFNLCRLLHEGLHDASQLVRSTANTALCAGWLARDCEHNCGMLLEKLMDGALDAGTPEAAEVAKIALRAARKALGEKLDVQVSLDKSNLTLVGALTWRAWVVERLAAPDASTGTEGGSGAAAVDDPTVSVLPPLKDYSAMLRDVAATFADPSRNSKTGINRTVTLANPDDAEAILQVLLSMFAQYEEQGYLAHCDDASRAAMIKPLQRLLTTVLETNTAIFVEDIMSAVRGLFHRHPLEALDCVGEAVRRLFDTLTLPKECGLTYDDAEVFGQREKQRREELAQLRGRRGAEERVQSLEEAVTNDTLYIYRMQHIVHQFLAHMNRSSDKVPSFCHSVIQLGRSLEDEGIREIATRSLCLELLMSPESVHTFVPVLVGEVTDEDKPHNKAREAALTSLFDVAAEYGLSFFQVTGAPIPRNHPTTGGSSSAAAEEQSPLPPAEVERIRLQKEAAASNDDAKFGGSALLQVLLSFLKKGGDGSGLSASAPPSGSTAMRRIALVGVAKLLACSRLVGADAVAALAWLLQSAYVVEGLQQSRGKGADPLNAEVLKVVEHFLSVFASSHHRRMRLVAEGGVLAFRLQAANGVRTSTEINCVIRMMRKVVQFTDASLLASIRDLDPKFAAAVRRDQQAQDTTAATGGESNLFGESAAGPEQPAAGSSRSSRKTTAGTDGALASAGVRLRRELARYSVHEYLAKEFLLEIASTGTIAAQCITPAISLLRLYRADAYQLAVLDHFASKAHAALSGGVKEEDGQPHPHKQIIDSLVSSYRAYVGPVPPEVNEMAAGRLSRPGVQGEWDTAVEARAAQLRTHAPIAAARLSGRVSGRKTARRSLSQPQRDDDDGPIGGVAPKREASSSEESVAIPAARRGRRRK